MIHQTRTELLSLFSYLVSLAKNPVEEIQKLPEIRWPTLVAFQFCLSLVSVSLSNLLAPFAISLTNVLISLLIAMLATGLVSLFFYQFFLIFHKRTLSFIKLFTLVLFAHIPFALFHLLAYSFPPAELIGLGISALLMIVGLVENFLVPRKVAMGLMGFCYSLFLIYWVGAVINMKQYQEASVPQELDHMEQEM